MYEPETDSEDELPPGWEERATLTGKMSRVKYLSVSMKSTFLFTFLKSQL